MTAEVTAIVVGAIVLFAIAFALGIRSERKAWTLRAYSRKPHASNTPHHCDGEFYYIVPESIFVHDFTRKETA